MNVSWVCFIHLCYVGRDDPCSVRCLYTYRREAFALLVSINWAMREPYRVERATRFGFTLFYLLSVDFPVRSHKEYLLLDIVEYKEVTIHNLQEFLAWVQDTYTIHASEDAGFTPACSYNKVYYRGQRDVKWNLTPGIFRSENKKKGDLKGSNTNVDPLNEYNVLKQAQLRLWNETQTLPSYLEKLIFFQHYGLKTRLLDVTFNPLIALYMACATPEPSESSESVGAVYYGYKCEEYKLRNANLTAEIIFTKENNSSINQFFRNRKLKGRDFSKPIFIWPPINNPRIEAQDGAFIMAPLLKYDGEGVYTNNHDSLNNSDFFMKSRAVIPEDCKEGILKELSRIGINTGSIYKGVTEKLQSVMEEERRKQLRPVDLSRINIKD